MPSTDCPILVGRFDLTLHEREVRLYRLGLWEAGNAGSGAGERADARVPNKPMQLTALVFKGRS